MKLNILTSALCSALLLFTACSKDDDTATPATNPNNPTQPKTEAAMKANVNNQAWEAATTSFATSGGMFTMAGFGKNGEDIIVRGFDLNKEGVYTSGAISYEINLGGGNFQQWNASLADSGNVFNVTKLDTINKTVSGTFAFKTTAYQGSVTDTTHKTVTNGTFTNIKMPN